MKYNTFIKLSTATLGLLTYDFIAYADPFQIEAFNESNVFGDPMEYGNEVNNLVVRLLAESSVLSAVQYLCSFFVNRINSATVPDSILMASIHYEGIERQIRQARLSRDIIATWGIMVAIVNRIALLKMMGPSVNTGNISPNHNFKDEILATASQLKHTSDTHLICKKINLCFLNIIKKSNSIGDILYKNRFANRVFLSYLNPNAHHLINAFTSIITMMCTKVLPKIKDNTKQVQKAKEIQRRINITVAELLEAKNNLKKLKYNPPNVFHKVGAPSEKDLQNARNNLNPVYPRPNINAGDLQNARDNLRSIHQSPRSTGIWGQQPPFNYQITPELLQETKANLKPIPAKTKSNSEYTGAGPSPDILQNARKNLRKLNNH